MVEARPTTLTPNAAIDAAVNKVLDQAQADRTPEPTLGTPARKPSILGRAKLAGTLALSMVAAACGVGDKPPATPTTLPTNTPGATQSFEPSSAPPSFEVTPPPVSPSPTPVEVTPSPTATAEAHKGSELIKKTYAKVKDQTIEDEIIALYTEGSAALSAYSSYISNTPLDDFKACLDGLPTSKGGEIYYDRMDYCDYALRGAAKTYYATQDPRAWTLTENIMAHIQNSKFLPKEFKIKMINNAKSFPGSL